MILIGHKAPHFSIQAVTRQGVATITDKDLLGSYTLLFFYALDFSFICPGELHRLQDTLKEFDTRKTRVLAISVDSIYTHAKWLSTPRAESGIEGTEFALVSDMSQKLSRAFNVFDDENGHSLRASFVMDEDNIIQYGAANSFAFGRSISELLRIIDAIQSIKAGTVAYCTVNWRRHLDEPKTSPRP